MLMGSQIRQAFLDFFAARGHKILPSSALVPEDPTTLFTTAGMQQFVPWFRREVTPPFGSVVTVQKCARTDDLDQVGRTVRHHTFFEMLGNFSFGDYFKAETLRWGWEFATLPVEKGGIALDDERIWVTYYRPLAGEPYQEDLEARDIWLAIGVPAERIIPLGKKENWWGPVGESGPCGPCSEMHYDRGEEFACGPECKTPECGCDRWIEFWNHVFQQFNFSAGEYTPLPTPGIDTGAGLERIASLVQHVNSNFDCDLLRPIIDATVKLAGQQQEEAGQQMALRVIADHLRCSCFMIADGVLPSNVKRGYVVRRIIRRAYRFGRQLGFKAPFLYQLVPSLITIAGDCYPELVDNSRLIIETLQSEEKRFAVTLERGEDLLAALISEAQQNGQKSLAGKDVFTLYDTYGFPSELTAETALEAGLSLDEEGYQQALALAREIAKGEGKFSYVAQLSLGGELPATEFVGYEQHECSAIVQLVAQTEKKNIALLVLDRSPFYAASGGQNSDTGEILWQGISLPVNEVTKDKFGHFLHSVVLPDNEENCPQIGDVVMAKISLSRRAGIRRAHTATHLLHLALQQVLGDHARQTGSLVEDDTLRFDFSHPVALTAAQINEVAQLVYQNILADEAVTVQEMAQQQAREAGYTALFGEKYGEWVRTVNIGDDNAGSRELCGGTHVARSGEIGLFTIISEGSVSAGNRRIEACTGIKAAEEARQQKQLLAEITLVLKVLPAELLPRFQAMQQEVRNLQAQLNDYKVKIAALSDGPDEVQAELIGEIKVIFRQLSGVEAETMAGLCEEYLPRVAPGIVVLTSVLPGKVLLAVKVSKELTGQFHAGNIVRAMAKITGGGGGGRPDFAQAGGKDETKILAALQEVREMILKR